MKQCTKCKKTKPLSDFYRASKSSKYYRSKCKKCQIEYWDARQKQEPIKYSARRKLRTKVASGTIVKPEKCECCKKKGLLHGHHDDYSAPFKVKWLCPSCHSLLHRKHMKCIVDGCELRPCSKGCCAKHYYIMYVKPRNLLKQAMRTA